MHQSARPHSLLQGRWVANLLVQVVDLTTDLLGSSECRHYAYGSVIQRSVNSLCNDENELIMKLSR